MPGLTIPVFSSTPSPYRVPRLRATTITASSGFGDLLGAAQTQGTMRAAWFIVLAGCTSKWADVGVTDPVAVRMMEEWQRRGLESKNRLQEWSIDFSPSRRCGVIYRLYVHQPEGETFLRAETTYTYFRIEGAQPVFVRHEVWPEMTWSAVNDDGSALVVQFNYASLRWNAINSQGHRTSGMLLQSQCELPTTEPDGSFLLSTGLADYRIRVEPHGAQIRLIGFRDDARFHDNGRLDGLATLPYNLPAEDAEQFRSHLRELRTSEIPCNRSAKYIHAYAAAALALENWSSPDPVALPSVRQVLQEIAEKP